MTNKRGRPRLDQEAPMEITPVRLTYWHVRKARVLGNGNVSEGIRRAIESAVLVMSQLDEQINRQEK